MTHRPPFPAKPGATTGGCSYDPEKHPLDKRHRRTIRLKGYDYSRAGAYFITICAQDRRCLFGEIVDGVMQLNDAGRVVAECWLGIPDHFSGVELDADVVMPNHFHGIIIVGARHAVPLPITSPPERFGKPVTGSIPTILRSFKSAVTKGINELYGTPGATIWQRNYYEHIIRHDESLNRIRQYINDNPLQWALDRENPTCNNSEILVGANPSVCTQKDEPWRI